MDKAGGKAIINSTRKKRRKKYIHLSKNQEMSKNMLPTGYTL
jgi:hypothetical protein